MVNTHLKRTAFTSATEDSVKNQQRFKTNLRRSLLIFAAIALLLSACNTTASIEDAGVQQPLTDSQSSAAQNTNSTEEETNRRADTAANSAESTSNGANSDGENAETASGQPTTQPATGSQGSQNTEDRASRQGGAPTETTSQPAIEIYKKYSASVMYVITPDDTSGTAFLIDGGYLVTNEHVVSLFEQVQLVDGHGKDLGLVEVAGIDTVYDLAILGPIDTTNYEVLSFGDSTQQQIGQRSFFLGYPDEINDLPNAVITEGIISGRRSYAIGDNSFFQVDALIAPGQSGGPLLNDQGQVIGVAELSYGSANFALAIESNVAKTHVDTLISTHRNAEVQKQWGPGVTERQSEIVDKIGPSRFFAVVVLPDRSNRIKVAAQASGDFSIELLSLGGETIYGPDPEIDYFALQSDEENQNAQNFYVEESSGRGQKLLNVVVDDQPYLLLVRSHNDPETDVRLSSNNEMYRLKDIENDLELVAGEVAPGVIDWDGDVDSWQVELTEGQKAQITVGGIIDTYMVVRHNGELIASNDDVRIGVYGTSSQVKFTAPTTDSYQIEVGAYDFGRGGYVIELITE